MKTRAIAVLLAMVLSGPASAQVGRYQLVTPNTESRERYLVDTQTGMTWMLIQEACPGAKGDIPGCMVNSWSTVPYLKAKEGGKTWWPAPPAIGEGYVAPIAK